MWLTRRAPQRPLTYPAMRRVLQRANAHLGTTTTLHQLRHTAAQRMIADPRMSLSDVSWVLGHAHLATTEVYLQPTEDEVVARVREQSSPTPGRAAAGAPVWRLPARSPADSAGRSGRC